MTLVSKKFSVTVPDQIFDLLEEWADEQGRPTANLAAYLIESGLRAAIDKKEFMPKPNKPRRSNE